MGLCQCDVLCLAKTTVNAKKKTLRSSQAQTERVQKLRIEYWEKVRDIDPENLVFLDEMGVLLGLTRTYARSPIAAAESMTLSPITEAQK